MSKITEDKFLDMVKKRIKKEGAANYADRIGLKHSQYLYLVMNKKVPVHKLILKDFNVTRHKRIIVSYTYNEDKQ